MFFMVKGVLGGDVEGEAVVTKPLSPLGDIDPRTGNVRVNSEVVSIKGKIVIMERMKGSTVGSYVLYALGRRGTAPKAIVVSYADPVLVAGCVLGNITLAYGVERAFFRYVRTGSRVRINSSLKRVELVDV
ncbi:MAG: hypothetical protein DRO12_05585 [Thermoprotei archaeon]|nr:MAG: hypothetical protein DRO12_05585 [Thermoprotei archaeon]